MQGNKLFKKEQRSWIMKERITSRPLNEWNMKWESCKEDRVSSRKKSFIS